MSALYIFLIDFCDALKASESDTRDHSNALCFDSSKIVSSYCLVDFFVGLADVSSAGFE